MSSKGGLLGVIGGAIAGGAIALAISAGSGTSHSTTTTVIQSSRGVPTALSSSHGMTINQIYRAASPGVVDITVTSTSNSGGFGPFGGGSQQTEGEGAGVVYDTKGDILTDEHVVAGAQSVTVNFRNGFKVGAKVLGTDPSTDVAVIRVNCSVLGASSDPAGQLQWRAGR